MDIQNNINNINGKTVVRFKVKSRLDIPDIPNDVTHMIWRMDRPCDALIDFKEIVSITFGQFFNHSLEPLKELPKLERIGFGRHFNQSLYPLRELLNLKYVGFNNRWDIPCKAIFNLEHIYMLKYLDVNKYWEELNKIYLEYATLSGSEIHVCNNTVSFFESVNPRYHIKNNGICFRSELEIFVKQFNEVTIDDIDNFLSSSSNVNIKPAKN